MDCCHGGRASELRRDFSATSISSVEHSDDSDGDDMHSERGGKVRLTPRDREPSFCKMLTAGTAVLAFAAAAYLLTAAYLESSPADASGDGAAAQRKAEDNFLFKMNPFPVLNNLTGQQPAAPEPALMSKIIAPIVLGFNEPDQGYGIGGAHLNCFFDNCYEPVKHWMDMVTASRAKGYTSFVGPGVARRNIGIQWYRAFLNDCCKIDGCPESISYLNYHWYETQCYGAPATPPNWKGRESQIREDFKRLLATYMRPDSPLYPQLSELQRREAEAAQPACRKYDFKGLFITELAVRNKFCNLEKQTEFAKLIVPELAKDPFVSAFSWFSYDDKYSHFVPPGMDARLWDFSSGNLTSLGEAYFATCNNVKHMTPLGAELPFPSKCGVVLKDHGDNGNDQQKLSQETLVKIATTPGLSWLYNWQHRPGRWPAALLAGGLTWMPQYWDGNSDPKENTDLFPDRLQPLSY
eukprot:TRINITY_DN5234_c0_g1_i1.p1 TRINITY_DN5234_c0_g1~~TRINITY_DN5234_c0_g1_i1.p1  ORF type:complete len:466 (+),score=70.81 TRINITY_DN5234_c0_g1_i1:109-1506(+)